ATSLFAACDFVLSVVSCVSLFFFFSSRRRHTRFSRDWSSDVCSSDLACRSGSPVDGVVGRLGMIRSGKLLQAKGRWYSAADLLRSEERRVGKECRSRRWPDQ